MKTFDVSFKKKYYAEPDGLVQTIKKNSSTKFISSGIEGLRTYGTQKFYLTAFGGKNFILSYFEKQLFMNLVY